MIARCGAGCIQVSIVRVILRCYDPIPVDVDFCEHHWKRHHEALLAAPNFICAVPLDEDGQPIPAPSADDTEDVA